MTPAGLSPTHLCCLAQGQETRHLRYTDGALQLQETFVDDNLPREAFTAFCLVNHIIS